MRKLLILSVVGTMLAVVAGFQLGKAASAQAASERVFELRTYTTPEGKLEPLLARFRDHTMAIFEKHGITNVAYWVPTDKPNTLIYLISHESREAAEASWAAFRADPDWQKVRAAAEQDGPLTTNIESVYMTATDFSPMQ
jgi:hypothetical protein